jgi:hypothetical protein
MKYFFLFITILFLLGCKKDSVASLNNSIPTLVVLLNDTVNVKVCQTVRLSNGELVFQFDSVLDDSRCPIGVECLWQGNASILLKFPDHIDTLNTFYEQGQVEYGNYKVRMIDLLPWPIWQQPIDKNTYVARLKVTQ